jgi:hypothetical protein
MVRRHPIFLAAALCGAALASSKPHAQSVSPAEARVIAKDAYIYGFPLVDSYRMQYSYFVDRAGAQFKGPWNEIHNTAHVYTPDDKLIQTPNLDTPYSQLGADLRTEPLVLTVPAVEKSRYYSAQFIDMYTFDFGYAGGRSTGNATSSYLLAGPHWRGAVPKGIRAVIRAETEFVFVLYRTQLFNAGDLENVQKVQAGYKVQTLSQFLGKPARTAAPAIKFVEPLTPVDERTSLQFFNILNFVLRFCPTHPSEKPLMARFAKLGVGAGRTFDAQNLNADVRKAVEVGMADAWQAYEAIEKQMVSGERTSADLFGTRGYLKNNYLYRMVGAVDAIYGNAKEEAIYRNYLIDSTGQRTDGSSNRYTLRFAPGQLPPVNAFWSLTMYDLPTRLLVANPLNRYLVNSSMLPNLKRETNGGVTLYIQHESPGKDRESNWLPAPSGPFSMVLRLYWPKPGAQSGAWKAPPLQRSNGVEPVDMGSRALQ